MDAVKSLNKRYGRLIVLEIVGKDNHGHKKVRCLCDCGNEKVLVLNKIRQGDSRSCGCLQKEWAKKQMKEVFKKCPNFINRLEPRLATAKSIYQTRYSDGDLSFQDFLDLSQQKCYYCHAPPANKDNRFNTKDNRYSKERREGGDFIYNGLDRVNNVKKHTLNNVVPCCLSCNKSKLNRTKKEFLDWINKVYQIHCSKN